ncbi:MAG: type II toxin-antitoxin system RelE/ParE family toxin [Acidobacteria bacterium]|nr:type II toxin-antitoxin system RelE/ParE family toxin [Acidobacteriota bacterium]MBI3658725.1 type II toxin-antitoxin system RelE/ParE family toxin [Acidobacteriota bacterium]
MSVRYAVRWTDTAEADLEAIIGFIAEESLDTARHILERLRKKAINLKNIPERGRLVPEFKAHGIVIYRELILTPWRSIYRITGKTVYVLAVLDSRRNLEDILLDRFVD